VVPKVEPDEMTKLAGVPVTVVTVPEPSVVLLKSRVRDDAEMVSALPETEAEIGCIFDVAIVVPSAF
jgi:hypothetical protein